MTAIDRFERALADWLEDEAGPRLPAYTDDFIARLERTHQRPRWLIAERWLPMTSLALSPVARTPRARYVLIALAVLAIALVGIVLVAGSRPRVPPPFGVAADGLIAVADNSQIVAFNPDGSGRRVLISGGDDNRPMDWSRDGSRLAFVRTTGGASQLMAADADGSGVVQLSSQPFDDGQGWVSWAPDGSAVAYVSRDAGGSPRLFVADSHGAGSHPVLPDLAIDLTSWSPDGSWLLFRATRDDGATFELARSHPDGSSFTVLPAACGVGLPCFGSYSPDGSRIAFHATRPGTTDTYQVHVMNADGSGGRVVAEAKTYSGTFASDFAPVWSPDGTRILFDSNREGDYRFFVANPDSDSPAVGTGPKEDIGSAMWSPDGRSILADYNGDDHVWRLDPAGGPGQIETLPGPDLPAWQRLAP